MNKLYKTLLTLFLCFMLAFANATPIMTALAEEVEKSKYTDVLTDLTSDETFNTGDYPSITDTSNTVYGSISVIQVAESIDDELFIYTYQPSESTVQFTATSILMWDSFNDKGFDENVIQEFHPIVYELELLSKSGVFAKYLVKDYTVSDEGYRYYNIATIWRPYDENIDEGLQDSDTGEVVDNGTTVERAYAVGQQWCMYTFNDVYHCEMVTFETMEIDITYHGYLTFSDGLTWGNLVGTYTQGTSHFIAFNCEEYKIKHIYDADVQFSLREKHISGIRGGAWSTTYSDWTPQPVVTLRDSDRVSFTGSGLFSQSATWNRISRASDFVDNMTNQGVDWKETVVETLENSQWVFAFYESEIRETSSGTILSQSYDIYSYETGETAVLRIHFMDDSGKIYNLAVVSDKTNSAEKPANNFGLDIDFSIFEDWFAVFASILGIIAIAFLLMLCVPLINGFIKIVVPVANAVLDVLITVLSAPFELIGNLFGGGKKKK